MRARAASTRSLPLQARRGLLILDLLPEIAVVAIAVAGVLALLAIAPTRARTPAAPQTKTAPNPSEDRPIFGFAVLPHNRMLAAMQIGNLELRGLSDAGPGLKVSTVVDGHQPQHRTVFRLATAPEAGGMVLAGSQSGLVLFWPRFGGPTDPPELLADDHGFVTAVAMDPRGEWGATAGTDLTVRLWSLRDRKLVWLAKTGQLPATTIAFSPDARNLAWGSHNQISLASVANGRAFDTISTATRTDEVTSMTFTADGRGLAFGTFDGLISLYAVAARRAVWTTPGDRKAVVSLARHPDGKTLFAGNSTGMLTMLDLAEAETMGVIQAHRMGVRKVQVAEDAGILLSVGYEGVIRRWDLESMVELP